MKKKIVLIVEAGGGVNKHVRDLYFNLKESNEFKIYIVFSKNRKDSNYEEFIEKDKESFFEIKSLKRNVGYSDIKSIFEIKKILKKIQPDVVHCHSSKAGLSGRIAAKMTKVKKIIYSPHAYFFLKYKDKSIKRFIFLLVEKILSKFFTNYTVVTSKGEEQVYLENKIDKRNKYILIEHGINIKNLEQIDIENYKNKLNIKDGNIIIGAMARLEEQKDPIGTIKIMENIVKEIPNTYCVLFGNGSMYKEILKLHQEIQDNYRNKIIIAGETKTPELAIEIMDIYLTASLYEGLPYTLLMALGHRKPILGTNVEGNKDCIIQGKNGFIYEVGKYKEVITLCKKIIEKDIKKMGQESFNIYKTRFSVNKMIENYKTLYLGGIK